MISLTAHQAQVLRDAPIAVPAYTGHPDGGVSLFSRPRQRERLARGLWLRGLLTFEASDTWAPRAGGLLLRSPAGDRALDDHDAPATRKDAGRRA